MVYRKVQFILFTILSLILFSGCSNPNGAFFISDKDVLHEVYPDLIGKKVRTKDRFDLYRTGLDGIGELVPQDDYTTQRMEDVYVYYYDQSGIHDDQKQLLTRPYKKMRKKAFGCMEKGEIITPNFFAKQHDYNTFTGRIESFHRAYFSLRVDNKIMQIEIDRLLLVDPHTGKKVPNPKYLEVVGQE